MATKIFGAINAPGVQVRLNDSVGAPSQSGFGWTAMAGVFERGPTNKTQVVFADDFAKILGGEILDSKSYQDVKNFFRYNQGVTPLIVMRVTDGTELQAEVDLYARKLVRTPIGKLKAKNGGRWGGADLKHVGVYTLAGDLTNTTLTTGVTSWKKDQWKGASLELTGVPGTSYTVVSNTAAGVITVEADKKMAADYAALAATSKQYYLTLSAGSKALSYKVTYSADKTSYFNLTIYDSGTLVKSYENISFKTDDNRYWVNVINDDASNYWVEAVDTWTGGRNDESIRPCNFYSSYTKSTDLTATTLKPAIYEYKINSAGGGNPTAAVTMASTNIEQVITLTFSNATTFTAASDKLGALGSGTLGVAFTAPNKWTPAFTITAGATPMAASDTINLTLKPLVVDSLIDHELFPDVTGNKRLFYKIKSNTFDTITIRPGFDMTVDLAAAGATPTMLLCAPTKLAGGRDGHASIQSTDYTKHFEFSTSPFNVYKNQNYGLIKFMVPGVSTALVQKAVAEYVNASGYMVYHETDISKNTNTSIESFLLDDIGRTDGAVGFAVTQGYVTNDQSGKLELVSLLPMILGLAAKKAVDDSGYTEPAAGISYRLPTVVKLATDNVLSQEYLNPLGINSVDKKNGNFVVWGSRTLAVETTNQSASVYAQMFHWVHYLRENFYPYVFKRNSPAVRGNLKFSILNYFSEEYKNNHLDSNYAFEDVFTLVMDGTNNNKLTAANGELNVYLELLPSNHIERIIFTVDKQGVGVQ